ncbi:MAG: hypothetical protein ACREX0_03910 [Noviherbaspirillum sp.]
MLREDEDRYGRLIERCADSILLVRQSQVVGANRAAARLTGCASPEQLNGRALPDVLQAALPLADCPAALCVKLPLPDGSAIDAEVDISAYPDAAGQDTRLLVIRDLSARRQIADTLSQQGRYLRLITDKVPALIAYVDAD